MNPESPYRNFLQRCSGVRKAPCTASSNCQWSNSRCKKKTVASSPRASPPRASPRASPRRASPRASPKAKARASPKAKQEKGYSYYKGVRIPKPDDNEFRVLNIDYYNGGNIRDIVKKAYRKMSLIFHPDKYQGDDINMAIETMKLINKAYENLKLLA